MNSMFNSTNLRKLLFSNFGNWRSDIAYIYPKTVCFGLEIGFLNELPIAVNEKETIE